MKSLFDIKDKVVIVTGATGVLAGATAKYLAQNGAKVAFLGRNKEKLDEARKFCESNGLCGMACECDVLNRPALESVREKVLGEWGTIDAIVNGAGRKSGWSCNPARPKLFRFGCGGVEFSF